MRRRRGRSRWRRSSIRCGGTHHLDLNGLVLGVGVPVAVESVVPRDFPDLRTRYQLLESPMKICAIVGFPHGGHDNAAR